MLVVVEKRGIHGSDVEFVASSNRPWIKPAPFHAFYKREDGDSSSSYMRFGKKILCDTMVVLGHCSTYGTLRILVSGATKRSG